MKILFIGDIFGKLGRQILQSTLPKLIREKGITFTIANAENTTQGKGLIEKHYRDLKATGIDVFTMGNHTFFQREIFDYLPNTQDLLVPANFSAYVNYCGSREFVKNGVSIRITNLLGHGLMQGNFTHCFAKLETIIAANKASYHIVDFHAETTSEKIAFALNFDGQISAVVGTHTHVQTADNKILPGGTGYITDVGMTGPANGVIGAIPQAVIARMKTGFYQRFSEQRQGPAQFNGIIFTFQNKRLVATERLNFEKNF